jgi:RimJ/RimL family protein N-acetyltransferase
LHVKIAAAAVQSLPLETSSLRLRHLVPEDAAHMMALNAETSTRHWLPSHVYPTLEDASSRLEFLISCYSSPGHPRSGPYVLAVEHKDEAKLLGHVGFSPFEGEVEVSYAIAELYRGRRYGTEALVHACNWLAEAFGVSRVLALTESENIISRRLLNRASFVLVNEAVMTFQGQEQLVSRYHWHPAGKRAAFSVDGNASRR